MAHELESTSSMVYTGATPWHRLGVKMEERTFIREIIPIIGADRPVFKERAQLADGTALDSWATVRRNHDGTRTVLGHSVGERYTILEDDAALRALEPFEALGMFVETAGYIGSGGKVVWASIKLNQSADIGKGGDKLDSYALMTHSHDGSLALTVGTTTIAVVCRNTLSAALRSGNLLKVRHTAGISTSVKQLGEALAKNAAAFAKQVELYNNLSRKSLTRKQVREFIESVTQSAPSRRVWTPDESTSLVDQLLPSATPTITSAAAAEDLDNRRRLVDEVLEMFETAPGQELESRRGTAWGALNAVSYYVTHKRGRGDDGDRFLSSQTGTGAAMLSRATERIMGMVA